MRVAGEVDGHRHCRHVERGADDPHLAGGEPGQQPRNGERGEGHHAEQHEQDGAGSEVRLEDEQEDGSDQHHAEAHPDELTLLCAHLVLKVTPELVATVGGRCFAWEAIRTLHRPLRLPYTRPTGEPCNSGAAQRVYRWPAPGDPTTPRGP